MLLGHWTGSHAIQKSCSFCCSNNFELHHRKSILEDNKANLFIDIFKRIYFKTLILVNEYQFKWFKYLNARWWGYFSPMENNRNLCFSTLNLGISKPKNSAPAGWLRTSEILTHPFRFSGKGKVQSKTSWKAELVSRGFLKPPMGNAWYTKPWRVFKAEILDSKDCIFGTSSHS